MAARAVMACISLAVAGWLALGLYQSRSEEQAKDVVLPFNRLDEREARRAERLLDRAAWLNPDVQPDIYRAILALDRGRSGPAVRTILGVTRREPRNIEAWAWLSTLARLDGDRALAARADRRIAELRPPVAPR
jgi:predicted Zn-dependent protease